MLALSTRALRRRCFSAFSAIDHVTRDSSLASITPDDVSFFQKTLGEANVTTDDAELSKYNKDYLGKYQGISRVALAPTTTEQVSAILRHCNDRRLPVVPQGGNTGLVGGSVPVFDEVVLSLSRMNRVLGFNAASRVLECEAGCVLEALDTLLREEHACIMPLDLGAKGSCQIGGNVSTNAGGIRLLRYGSLHGSVLGLEVVLPDGTVVDMMSGLRKDNTGYDLKQLFIGAEGTLGVVTKVAVLAAPAPRCVRTLFFGLRAFQDVVRLIGVAQEHLGEQISAIEFLDRASLELVERELAGRDPFAEPHAFYALIETHSSSDAMGPHEAMVAAALDAELVADGVIGSTDAEAAELWKLREGIAEALKHRGATYKYDVSVPTEQMYAVVEECAARVGDRGLTVGYGHVGDGNLHLNVSAPEYTEELTAQIEPWIYERTSELRGSISAEHGLGVMKPHKIHYSKSESAVRLMQQIKALVDPNGIMNPYKVLPSEFVGAKKLG